MAPLKLDGHTLGEKHRSYNKLLNEGYEPTETSKEDNDDISVLLKIDIARRRRNIDFILEVLKSEDQLYVSRAIKRSTWLITDPQYAHIINPEHLYTQLRHQMTSKAFNKLMLNIRLHLKDESRVEEFYNHIKKSNADSAFKWLQHCSVPLVEKEVVKHGYTIPDYLLVRLFEKSFSIFQVYTLRSSYRYTISIMNGAGFLAIKYPDQFLDFLKSLKQGFYFDFSKKATKAVMENCPQKILDNFELFGKRLDLATFAKYLNKKENIEEFLFKHVNNENLKWLYSHQNMQHFVHNMSKGDRFEFAKRVFIDKEFFQDQKKYQTERDMLLSRCAMKCSWNDCSQNTNTFQWYKYAPFEVAFSDLKKLIRAESTPAVRIAMFQVLISCTRQNKQHINTLLQYYHDKHINEPFKFKMQFVNHVMSRVDPLSLDDKAWNLLNQLFHSMEVFIPSENNVQSCIKFILVRYIISNEEIPEIIQQKFVFDTLKNMQKKLKSQGEKDAVFDFLYKMITNKYNKLNLTAKQEFIEAVLLCEELLNLINDWKKELNDHSDIVMIIKNLIEVNKNNKWGRDLSSLYNKKKSWKRVLFEESIELLPNDSVCVNALKHDPELLSRHKGVVADMWSNDSVSLKHLLRKIRLYWNGSLAEDWKRAYLERIEQSEGHKAIVSGLCTLLTQKTLNEILKKYAPIETKIDWNDIDQRTLSLRKQFAKNAYKARPLASIEEILPYAKGNYLQYAVPSVSSILSQMSANRTRQIIPLLLDSPVSLQKFGIRCAFHKLNPEELKPMLNDIWKSTKNPSIRCVLFLHTFSMLCKEENVIHAKFIWELMSMFIDHLTAEENKLIYQKLGEVYRVPDCVKPQFFMKSFTFLSSLPGKCNASDIWRRMLYNASDIMDSLDDDFVVNVILKDVNNTFTKDLNIYETSRLFSSFILSAKDGGKQIQRYKISLEPILKQVLPLWENIYDGKYRVKENIKNIFERVSNDIDIYTFKKKMHIPVETFETMQSEIESSLSYQKEYVFLTTWKLATTFVRILSDNSQVITDFEREDNDDKEMTIDEKDTMYSETHNQLAEPFAEQFVRYLKEDLKQFGSSIYLLFYAAFEKLIRGYLCDIMTNVEHRLRYAKCLLKYHDVKEVGLIVAQFLQYDLRVLDSDSSKQILEEIRETVNLHCCDEIQMHFNELFSNVPPFVLGASSSKEAGGCRF